jgi:hypothetical protein
MVAVSADNMNGVLVKPDIAKRQFDIETAMASPMPAAGAATAGSSPDG